MTPAPDDPPAAAGDYDERFDELAQLAYRVAFRIVGQREEARDIAQEAMARAYARWPKVRDKAAAWVSRVATNLALDRVRRARPTVRPPDESADVAQHAALRTDLVAALRRLPRRQRDVVVLRYLADLSEREVAELLGCHVGTVKQHASRGLGALRPLLTAPPPEPPDSPSPDPGAAPHPLVALDGLTPGRGSLLPAPLPEGPR